MITWTQVAACATVMVALGNLADNLLLNRHKRWCYDRVLKVWDYLDEIRIPDLHRSMATRTLKVIHTIFGSKIVSWRFLLVGTIMSFLLTTLALTQFFQKPWVFDDLNTASRRVWFYCVNWVFDLATFLITWKAITIIKETSIWVAVLIIAFDIYSAIVLAGFCYVIGVMFGNFFANVQVTAVLLPFHWPFNPSAVLHMIYDSLILGSKIVFIDGGLAYYLEKGTWTWMTDHLIVAIGVTRTDGLFMITMLVPTFIYMSILASILIGKVALGGARICALYAAERVTEGKPEENKLFTITASLFAVVVATAKLLGEVV
jgi:hypothetical protein